MTGRDSDNLSFCLLARYFGVPRVLARMLNPQYEVPYRLVGATKIHSEADILVSSFLTSIEYPEVGALMPLGRGELVITELADPGGLRRGGAGHRRPSSAAPSSPATASSSASRRKRTSGSRTGRPSSPPGRASSWPPTSRSWARSSAASPRWKAGRASPVQSRGRGARCAAWASWPASPRTTWPRWPPPRRWRHRKKGEVLYRRGDKGDRLYVLRAGGVDVESRDGRKTMLKPPAFFGERSALTGHPRSRTITVVEDAQLLSVDGAAVRAAGPAQPLRGRRGGEAPRGAARAVVPRSP